MDIPEKLNYYRKEGYPIEICEVCKNVSKIIIGEGIGLDNDTHYDITECVICENKKEVEKMNNNFMYSTEDNDELTPFIQEIVGDKEDILVDYHEYGDGRHKVTIGEKTLRIDAWTKKTDLTERIKELGV